MRSDAQRDDYTIGVFRGSRRGPPLRRARWPTRRDDRAKPWSTTSSIVGGGPAGLAAAIRLKQLAAEQQREVSVCVLEKGSEVGAHIAVRRGDRSARADRAPARLEGRRARRSRRAVTEDRFLMLTARQGVSACRTALLPRLMNNHGNYIVSLGNVCRWLGSRRRSARRRDLSGLRGGGGAVRRHGCRARASPPATWASRRTARTRPDYQPGMELHAKYTLFAEGCRGSLSQLLMRALQPARRRRSAEVRHRPQGAVGGRARRSTSRASSCTARAGRSTRDVGGGSFLYHYGENLVAVGFVVHLNYANPHLSPYDEFQRFKTHPAIRETFAGGKRTRVRRARDQRGRPAVGAEARVSRRRADRLQRRASSTCRASRAATTR